MNIVPPCAPDTRDVRFSSGSGGSASPWADAARRCIICVRGWRILGLLPTPRSHHMCTAATIAAAKHVLITTSRATISGGTGTGLWPPVDVVGMRTRLVRSENSTCTPMIVSFSSSAGACVCHNSAAPDYEFSTGGSVPLRILQSSQNSESQLSSQSQKCETDKRCTGG